MKAVCRMSKWQVNLCQYSFYLINHFEAMSTFASVLIYMIKL